MPHIVSTPAEAGLPLPTTLPIGGADPDVDDEQRAADGAGGEEEEETVESLRAEKAALEARLAERGDTLNALIERRPEPAAPAPRREPVAPADPGPMPSAADEPEKFAKWLEARDARRDFNTKQEIEALRRSHDDEGLRIQLWNDFQRLHPDQAKDPDLVAAAFQTTTGGKIPTDRAGQERMMKDVAERLGGSAKPKEDTRSNGKEADRTGGLSGGSRSRGTRRTPEDAKKTKNLKTQIQDRQAKSPFFR